MSRKTILLLALAFQTAAQTPTYLILQKGASSLAYYSADGKLQSEVPTGQHPHEMILSTDGHFLYTTDNGTMRYYFERLATVSSPEEAARYNGLMNPEKSASIREYLAEHEPGSYSMLHTSISPNIISAGYQVNVIPSEAEATLDIRALPDEDMPAFLEMLRKVINDPAVEVVPNTRNSRPVAPPSSITSEAFNAIEAANRKIYKAITLPTMSTGATDMAFLRARGVQCYGIGPMIDEEDAPKGFGAHSDQERILEEAFYKFLQFNWEIVTSLAASK